ncbi:hypothetical protein M413DRAFT_75846, partial [Hebeloma cylindrosporum]
LLDSFSVQGPNGTHTIFVQDLVGTPTALMRSLTRNAHRVLCHQLAQGLADLHRNGIVHGGEFSLGNVGVALPTLNEQLVEDIFSEEGHPECTVILPRQWPSSPQTLPAYLVPAISIIDHLAMWDPTLHETRLRAQILDLGSAVLFGDQTRPFHTVSVVCAPEIVFEVAAHEIKPPPTQAADIWSFACTIYHFVIGYPLFPSRCVQPNALLLGKLARFCGEVPRSWRGYWESQKVLHDLTISQEAADQAWDDMLRYLTTERKYTPLQERPTVAQVSELFQFLRFMLQMDPRRRPNAEQVLQHPWFRAVGRP